MASKSKLNVGTQSGTLDASGGMTRRLSMKIAKIVSVDAKKNTCSLEWLWPIRGGASDVPISRPYIGFRSGIHFVPEVGSIVVVGYAFNYLVMLSYLLPTNWENLINGEDDAKGNPVRVTQMQEGEVSLMSRQDSEIYLHEKVEIRDNNLDSIIIDPEDGSINLSSLEFNMVNEAGTMTMGTVSRNVLGTEKTITDDGLPVSDFGVGNALTEFKLDINEFSDASSLKENAPTVIAQVTVGTVVDNDGLKVLNQQGNEIVCNVELASGAKIQVDKEGNVNINEGRATKPTDVSPVIPIPLLETSQGVKSTSGFIPNPIGSPSAIVTPYVYTPLQAQQRAAREGDRVTIPLTPAIKPDLDHPGLLLKSVTNLTTMTQLASSFMSPVGPCTFIPVPGLQIVGEITQGANGVFIGSLNKTEELTESSKP